MLLLLLFFRQWEKTATDHWLETARFLLRNTINIVYLLVGIVDHFFGAAAAVARVPLHLPHMFVLHLFRSCWISMSMSSKEQKTMLNAIRMPQSLFDLFRLACVSFFSSSSSHNLWLKVLLTLVAQLVCSSNCEYNVLFTFIFMQFESMESET